MTADTAATGTLVHLLRLEDEQSHRQLLEALEGVTEPEAWAASQLTGRDYLHTDGSILGIVQHVAAAEVMYASAAFRQGEVRWRDCAAQLREIGADWEQSLRYLQEGHEYWLESWRMLPDSELPLARPTNWGETWSAWRIISTISHHAAYHAGQIALLRATLAPAEGPYTPFEADDIERHCRQSPYW